MRGAAHVQISTFLSTLRAFFSRWSSWSWWSAEQKHVALISCNKRSLITFIRADLWGFISLDYMFILQQHKVFSFSCRSDGRGAAGRRIFLFWWSWFRLSVGNWLVEVVLAAPRGLCCVMWCHCWFPLKLNKIIIFRKDVIVSCDVGGAAPLWNAVGNPAPASSLVMLS